MNIFPEGVAIVYCEGAFNTPNGKTAHGLVRRTDRYRVASVIDSQYAGQDARRVLDGKSSGIHVWPDVETAVSKADELGMKATHFVIGLAPDGGRLPGSAVESIRQAINLGLTVDSGLHDFLSENSEIAQLARKNNVEIRDIRKPPSRDRLHFFSGKIEQVTSFRVAVLGTDSAIGKRTTAWLLVEALLEAGYGAEMIGTGQTAWMQGAQYGIILDSLVNDFVSGEIEHVIWKAWKEKQPDVLVLEGQGSLLNPAYPGGFELLAAGRPHAVILQHAPRRKEYDGFPGYVMHPIEQQINAIELISGKPVVALALNHEGMRLEEIADEAKRLTKQTGLPCVDVLTQGPEQLVNALLSHMPKNEMHND